MQRKTTYSRKASKYHQDSCNKQNSGTKRRKVVLLIALLNMHFLILKEKESIDPKKFT